ncbi:hypothetical protein B0H12DRAFT_1233083 [Mycena haematopus]|nr:hypothetical protein B0H12DRAFT_1233083 [Mycena haematopus]
MDISSPPQRIHISTGTIPNKTIQNLAAAHPFTQQERPPCQLDVVFPANDAHALQAALSALETAYVKAELELHSLVEQAGAFVLPLEPKSTLTALSVTPYSDDVWCLDPRGVLTLHLSAESYQTLGITGQRLPFKSHSTEHTVTLPLRPSAESLKNRQKRDAALKAWDLRRKQAGEGRGGIVLCERCIRHWPIRRLQRTRGARACSKVPNDRLAGVRVPMVTLPGVPPQRILTPWKTGKKKCTRCLNGTRAMARLMDDDGRLQANDRADAYVAVYEPPQPSTATVGDIIHLRWRGFLGPDFVQSVADAV